jgi:hypothetical protein
MGSRHASLMSSQAATRTAGSPQRARSPLRAALAAGRRGVGSFPGRPAVQSALRPDRGPAGSVGALRHGRQRGDRQCWIPSPACAARCMGAGPQARRGCRGRRPPDPGCLRHTSAARVRREFSRLLCVLGSPAAAPKPSGRSPGRPKDRRSGPALRHPAIKKPTKNPGRSRPPPPRPPDPPNPPPRPPTSVDGRPPRPTG